MTLKGTFINAHGHQIGLRIDSEHGGAQVLEIGTDDAGVWFAVDSIETESQASDTRDVILPVQATVRLLCRDYMPALYGQDIDDVQVTVTRDGVCVFCGRVVPKMYSQPYEDVLDDVELTCCDLLGALEYRKYRRIGGGSVSYATAMAESGYRTMASLLTECLGTDVWHDGSVAVDGESTHRWTVFQDMEVNDRLLRGDDEQDVWTQREVVEEMLRLLGLHAVQRGRAVYLMNWKTVRESGNIQWARLDGTGLSEEQRSVVDITPHTASDHGSTITMADVWNRISARADVQQLENLVEDPITENSMEPMWSGRNRLMTEYVVDATGSSALAALKAMARGEHTEHKSASREEWWVRVCKAKDWKTPMRGHWSLMENMAKADVYQTAAIKDTLASYSWTALFMQAGSIKTMAYVTDNSPQRPDMERWMVLGVMGDKMSSHYVVDPESILLGCPAAEFDGGGKQAVFSPVDDDTVNYIVFSGRLVMNPRPSESVPYPDLLSDSPMTVVPVKSRTNGKGRLLSRQWWEEQKPGQTEGEWDGQLESYRYWYPYTGTDVEELEFKWSAVGDGEDKVSKVAVVQVMLVIGDKCVVEKQPGEDLGTGVPGTGNGVPEDYVWMPYKERSACQDDDEYWGQSFSIGVNPKIGDKLIGQEYDLQNNITHLMELDDTEGTAIPIRKADKVSGEVKLMILGPVNTIWSDYTRRHKTWFRHTTWTEDSVSLLSKTSSIIIKDLSIKVTSDSGRIDTGKADTDIIYVSDTVEESVMEMDEMTLRIHSGLTSKECAELGVKNAVRTSTPRLTATGEEMTTLWSIDEEGERKPEQTLVNAIYKEYHIPRLMMEQGMTEEEGITDVTLFRHPCIQGMLYPIGIDRNLASGQCVLHLKQSH